MAQKSTSASTSSTRANGTASTAEKARQEAKTRAESTAEKAKGSAQDAAAKVKQTAREAKQAAKSEARDMVEQAKSTATSKVEQVRDRAAHDVQAVSDALYKASDDMGNDTPEARAAGLAADTISNIADRVQSKDVRELVDDVSRFARSNPIAFLGGAALLGFAAARFAKASGGARSGQTNLPALSHDTAPAHTASRRTNSGGSQS